MDCAYRLDDYRVCAFFGFLEQVRIGVYVNPVLRIWDPFMHMAILWLPPQFNLLVESRHMQGGTQECYLRHFVLLLFLLSSSWAPQGRGEGWELSPDENCFTTYRVCVCVWLWALNPSELQLCHSKLEIIVFTSWSSSGNPQSHSDKDFNTILAIIIVATIIRGNYVFPSQFWSDVSLSVSSCLKPQTTVTPLPHLCSQFFLHGMVFYTKWYVWKMVIPLDTY